MNKFIITYCTDIFTILLCDSHTSCIKICYKAALSSPIMSFKVLECLGKNINSYIIKKILFYATDLFINKCCAKVKHSIHHAKLLSVILEWLLNWMNILLSSVDTFLLISLSIFRYFSLYYLWLLTDTFISCKE